MQSTDHNEMDSVKISLLTCSPGRKVWSLYGHTAIRLQDPHNGQDMVINYGMFDLRQKNFIPRFILGLTDYQMGITSFDDFMLEYTSLGREVIQQTLYLSNTEKYNIIQALYNNYLPQNRTYRYNYFYNNCTTRARDVLTANVNGKVDYHTGNDDTCSYRMLVHQWAKTQQWIRFGNDLLLGVKADARIDFQQKQFLPYNLKKDFDKATVLTPDGKHYKLVVSTTKLLNADNSGEEWEPTIWDSISPTMLFGALLVIILVISLIEIRRKKIFWLIDALLLTLDGLAGLVIFAMFFSQHPTVNINLQILLFNPLSIIFVFPVVKQQLKHSFHKYWYILAGSLVLFFIGGLFQNYAEGVYLLALCLLLRVISNYNICKRSASNSKI